MKIFTVLVFVLVLACKAGGSGVRADGKGQAVGEGESRVKRSDDTGLTSLAVVVQQQAAALQALQARVTAMENTLPASFQPVVFTARFSHDDSGGIRLGQRTILQFDAVVTNLGNGYNARTGVFTAPVSGVYLFLLKAMSHNDHGHLSLVIDKGGRTVLGETWARGSDDLDDQGSTHVTTHLSAGEQVWVRQNYGEAVRGGYWTVFTGLLVQAD